MGSTRPWVSVRASNLDGSFAVIGWVDDRPVLATCLDHEIRCSPALWERARSHLARGDRTGDEPDLVVVDVPLSRSLTAAFLTFVRACDGVARAEVRCRAGVGPSAGPALAARGD